ncbi:MAG: DNA replication and repair protein RecF [Verrucomicrobiales bacterium]|jgi:DNA replication and repair protein RecF|nr:DNA replication and repair protein RecF [Verrucomicrobiales bacterium]
MLTRLHLLDFRCHADFQFAAAAGCNLLLGANGRGKTSVLEAAYFLARGKSFRTHQTRELIRWGAAGFGIGGAFAGGDCQRLKVEWSEERRNLAVDGAENLSFREFWGRAPAVIFQNSDRQIVTGGGQSRRQWADGLLASIHGGYLAAIQRAQLLLKQKNALLRQERPDQALWSALTEQLADLSREVHRQRVAFTETAAPLLQQFYRDLTGHAETLTIAHAPKIPRCLDWSRDELWRRERERGLALLGPHRDDWTLTLFDRPLRDFGSEGQVKSAALALRILEARLIHENTAAWPLLLIDDALTDLDADRQRNFWHHLPADAQILHATTRPAAVPLPVTEVKI